MFQEIYSCIQELRKQKDQNQVPAHIRHPPAELTVDEAEAFKK